MGMLNPILALIPDIRVEFIGLKRDEKSLLPEEYYAQLPRINPKTITFVIDPMLATGGSMLHTIGCLKSQGGRFFIIITLITAPEAIDNLKKEETDIKLFTAAVDRGLNDKGFILPGLGDAGDRIFSTF
jgi:uracil phosphoribosyltransferase